MKYVIPTAMEAQLQAMYAYLLVQTYTKEADTTVLECRSIARYFLQNCLSPLCRNPVVIIDSTYDLQTKKII